MVVHSPYTTWDFNNLDNYENARQRKIELCHLTMSDAVKRAEEIGCELVIENVEADAPLIEDIAYTMDVYNDAANTTSLTINALALLQDDALVDLEGAPGFRC